MKRLEEAYMEMGEPDADQDALMEENWKSSRPSLDNANAWDLDSRLDQAMDALRGPLPDVLVDNLSGGERRRVALCKLAADSSTCCSTRPTTSTPSRSSGSRATSPATPVLSWP